MTVAACLAAAFASAPIGIATGLNITGTTGKYEVLPTSDFTAAVSLHFSAKVENSMQLKGAANATAVSAQLTNSTFSGKNVVFEATSDRNMATGLVAVGMTGTSRPQKTGRARSSSTRKSQTALGSRAPTMFRRASPRIHSSG